MLPIGPLMIEHRLIERLIKIIQLKLQKFQEKKEADPTFVEIAIDFIRMYADRCHHGKEEDILFRELKKKQISSEHRQIMEELIEDHRFGRRTTQDLVEANRKYGKGDESALGTIVERLKTLVDFYPKHIEKEDKRFFMPVMGYFTNEEKDAMLKEGYEFDQKLIHEKYQNIVSLLEQERTPA